MIQLKIAFLDEEESYLEQLKGYLIRKKELFFKIWTFSKKESFLEGIKKTDFDAVVMTEHFWKALDGQSIRAKKILLSEGRRSAEWEMYDHVGKYQPAEKLFCQISALLWQEERKEDTELPEHVARLIGVYSPCNYEGQMLFSLTLAQILSQQQKVLYVNLMEYSGFAGLTGTDAGEDVGDLFYGIQQMNRDTAAGLHRIRQSYREFDYIPPVANPEHLSEISKSQYEQFLMTLRNGSGYDVVIIDFGRIFQGFAEMLPIFSAVYCLRKDGVLQRYQAEEFLDYIHKACDGDSSYIQSLIMQERLFKREDGNLLENCLYGAMGDYIRREMISEGEEHSGGMDEENYGRGDGY